MFVPAGNDGSGSGYSQHQLLVVTLCILAACSERPTEPGTRVRAREGQYVAASTILVEPVGGVSPVVSQTATTMVLSGSRRDITPGKIVLSTAGAGALRKVVSISESGGNTTLTTSQASLVEAFDSLRTVDTLAFSKDQLGDIPSDVPGLSFEWVTSAAVASDPTFGGERSGKAYGAEFNKLKISFMGVSLSTMQGMTLTGTSYVDVKPVFDLRIGREQAKLLPSVAQMRVGIRTRVDGSLTLTSLYGGNLSVAKTFFDAAIGPPQLYGFLVFQPHLKIEASVAGTASGRINHTQSLGVDAFAYVDYVRGSGWTSSKSVTPSLSAVEANVTGQFGIVFKPIVVTLSYDLYSIAGPYGKVNAHVTANGTHMVKNSTEGIDAVVTAGVEGEVGLAARTPGALSNLFEASWTPVDVKFDLLKIELFHQFFPFTGAASITVGDNGPSPDDIFTVSLDGNLLGTTDKGGTGGFRASNLVPGTHSLTIKCVDDGWGGADVCTLGVILRDGLTFAGGATSLSDQLYLNESKSYVIKVPVTSASTSESPPLASRGGLPPSRVQFEGPRPARRSPP